MDPQLFGEYNAVLCLIHITVYELNLKVYVKCYERRKNSRLVKC